jgi:biopolymer transport protein ExbB
VLTIFGTGNAKAMSGGISEALITTQLGLVVAILGLFANSVIQRWARGCEQLMREVAHHITRKFEQ